MSEEKLQTNFVRYLTLKYPKARYCSSLGGIRTSMRQAIKAKSNGYVKGFPDIQICEAKGGFHGLFIELKYKGYPTKEQKEWIKDLSERGYKSVVARGLDQACDVLNDYMEKPTTKTCACKITKYIDEGEQIDALVGIRHGAT
jgi:hypothetical protein